MKKLAFFDAKPYDRESFDRINDRYEIHYFESKLGPETAPLAAGFEAVCAFVNDNLNAETISQLHRQGTEVIVMRCAGYSNVDFCAAWEKIHVLRVPAYSPHAIAEHAMALLLCLNRRLHRSYNRTREFNFNISGLEGMDLHGKNVGVIGTGRIGRCFIEICRGLGMHIAAYDLHPATDADFEYMPLMELIRRSDVISLHCPLTPQSRYMLNQQAFSAMRTGVFLINTSRGALIDSSALLDALNRGVIGGAGLDVYEEESEYFFEDRSNQPRRDEILALLVSHPNVLLTSHQAFLTREALDNIAETTLNNLDEFFGGNPLTNEVCYHCDSGKIIEDCRELRRERCF